MGQKHDREFEGKNQNQNRGYVFRPFRYLEQNSKLAMRIHKHKVYMGYFSPSPSAGHFILQNKYVSYLFHLLCWLCHSSEDRGCKKKFSGWISNWNPFWMDLDEVEERTFIKKWPLHFIILTNEEWNTGHNLMCIFQ